MILIPEFSRLLKNRTQTALDNCDLVLVHSMARPAIRAGELNPKLVAADRLIQKSRESDLKIFYGTLPNYARYSSRKGCTTFYFLLASSPEIVLEAVRLWPRDSVSVNLGLN